IKAAYQKFERSVALAYLQDQLANDKTLSRFLVQAVRDKDGDLSYMSPRPLSPAEVVQFETGHKFDSSSPVAMKAGNISGIFYPTPSSDEELADFVLRRLSDSERIALLENSLAAPSDP